METKSPETNMKTSNIITLLLWVSTNYVNTGEQLSYQIKALYQVTYKNQIILRIML